MKNTTKTIYCCQCQCDVAASLTSGDAVYRNRPDLSDLPFWQCPTCRNFVGCHHKTKDRTRPLGCIPTPAIRDARKKLHDLIDPLWKDGRISRRALYAEISNIIGYEFHSAETRTIEDARKIWRAVIGIKQSKGFK